MKKSLKVSIDEDVLKEAKEQINNLSSFVEESFRFYLGLDNDNRNKELKLKELSNEINNKQFQRYLIEKSLVNKENNERVFLEEKNRRWRKLWNYYYLYRTYDFEKMSDAIDILGMKEEEIVLIMETLIEYKDEIDFKSSDKWDYAFKVYKQVSE